MAWFPLLILLLAPAAPASPGRGGSLPIMVMTGPGAVSLRRARGVRLLALLALLTLALKFIVEWRHSRNHGAQS